MSDIDILQQMNDIDLSKVETSFPMLDSGIADFQVKACEMRRDTDKKADAKPYCFIELTLTAPWRTTSFNGDSRVINPGDRGSTINKRVYIGQYEDKNTHELKWYGIDELARFRESAYGKAPAGTKFNPAEMLGQNIKARLKFDPAPKGKDGTIYGPRTEVDAFIAKRV